MSEQRKRTTSILTKLLFSVALFLFISFSLIFIIFNHIFSGISDTLEQKSYAIIDDKYREQLRTSTEIGVSMFRTINNLDIDPETKSKIIRDIIRGVKWGEDGYYYVYEAGSGINYIHGANIANEGKNLWDLQNPMKTEFIIRELDRTAKEKKYYHDFFWPKPGLSEPVPKKGTAVMIPDTNYWIGTGIYVDGVENDRYIIKSGLNNLIRNARIVILSGFGIVFVILIFLVYGSLRHFLGPIEDLQGFTVEIARGDLTKKVGVFSGDEIGKLSEYFNAFVARMKENMIRVKKSAAVLNRSIQDLSVTSREIASTSNQQAASVKEIVSTMEDADSLSRSVAEKINEVADIAKTTQKNVTQGSDIVKENLAKMVEIKKSNQKTIEGIQSLGDQVKSIWEIVSIINSIADQTRIIAFNAELEASAAGEAGKNFEIVAAEIRRLADSTVQSTREIQARIHEIQSSTDSVIIASEDSTEKIREGSDLISRLESVFGEVQVSSETTSKSAAMIATSIHQQVMSFEQILLTLRQISEGIDNFVTSTRSTTDSTESLKAMAMDLNDILKQYIVENEEHEIKEL